MIVEELTKPFMKWISTEPSAKNLPIIKMSEIDRSNIANEVEIRKDQQLKESSLCPISGKVTERDPNTWNMTFDTSEFNELDFQKFVEDLSLPEGNANASNTGTLRNRIRYEKIGNKERIVVDHMPNLESDEIAKLVKVKIIIPKVNKPLIIDTATYAGKPEQPKFPMLGQSVPKSINKTYTQGGDSQIVKDLVTSRFRDVLINCFEKTSHRQSSRIQNLRVQNTTLNGSISSQSQSESAIDSNFESENTEKSYEFKSEDLNYEIDKIISEHQKSTKNFEDASVADSVIEYDEKKFLEEALGTELANMTSTVDFNNTLRTQSIGTSNISALISTRDISDVENGANETATTNTSFYKNQHKLLQLIMQSKMQSQVIAQTSKALNFCKNTNFNLSEEHLEAERILLHSISKYSAIRDAIRRLEYEDLDQCDKSKIGRIKITQMVFSTELMNPRNASKPKNRDYCEWFVCVLTSGTQVVITKNVQASYDGLIRFLDEIVFDGLHINFEITIAVYTIRVRNQLKCISYESRYHLDKETPTMCPLSPPRIFYASAKRQCLKKSPSQTEYCNEPSAYEFGGHCVIHRDNLNNMGHYTLTKLATGSLQRNFVIDFDSEVQILESHSGFLDVGIEKGDCISWNRRWCVLEGHVLLFFNYPDETKPVAAIDIKNMASAQIGKAGRQLCARPRTLFVELFVQKDEAFVTRSLVKYFLSADSIEDMQTWEAKLNSILSALRVWNAMNYTRN